MNCRATCLAAMLLAVSGPTLTGATDFSIYRGFRLGSSLAATAQQAGVKASEATVIHQRPAVIQELAWRPASNYTFEAREGDTVQEGLLRFCDGQLFQIVVTYERDRVEGMSVTDMMEAISAFYGDASQPKEEIPYHSNFGETAPVLARWENPEYSVSLVRTGARTSYALILSSKRLDARAQTAIAEATRLDALEAPQRAVALERKQAADEQNALDKARAANKPKFRP